VPGLWRAVALLVLAGTMSQRAHAADDMVPADRQVLILSRALAYDANLKTRAGDRVTIAVLAKPGDPASQATAAALVNAWKALAAIKLHGLPVTGVALDFVGGASLQQQIASQGIDAVYVTAGLDADLTAITAVTRQRQVISLAARRDQITRGLSLGVFAVDGKPTIVVNLPASRTEGAAFASDLLRLAVVIK
jgi:hypothetical protein